VRRKVYKGDSVTIRKTGREAIRHRDDLTGEHRLGDAGQLILFLIFLAVWITDSFFFKYSSFLNNYIPPAVQITLGAILPDYCRLPGNDLYENSIW